MEDGKLFIEVVVYEPDPTVLLTILLLRVPTIPVKDAARVVFPTPMHLSRCCANRSVLNDRLQTGHPTNSFGSLEGSRFQISLPPALLVPGGVDIALDPFGMVEETLLLGETIPSKIVVPALSKFGATALGIVTTPYLSISSHICSFVV